MRVRTADPAERPAVANVIDGAALAVDDSLLERALDRGDVLVAVEDGPDRPAEPRVLGALVLDGETIVAVAVRRRRRDQGVGTALVETAADRRDRLAASFAPRVVPFWDALGFAIEPAEETGRFRGVRAHSDDSGDGR